MPRTDLIERLAQRQAECTRNGLLRRLRTVEAIDSTRIVLGSKRLCSFASNDYLGLAAHPDLRQALTEAARNWGVGATAAHLLGGHRVAHTALQEELADWTGRERVLLYSTGFMANLGVIDALLRRGERCVQDRLNHASLLDGARLAGARLIRYPHLDADGAARQLSRHIDTPTLLASDGVFSMDGDIAPLPQLADLCIRHQATLLIDDAHGLGVLGPQGAGSLAAAGLEPTQVPILMATLGKALGVCGAFVAGSADLIEGLGQFSRTHIYTTAMPPALAAASLAAVRLARHADGYRERLQQRIAQFRHGARQLGLALLDSSTPIQPLRVGAATTALAWSQALENAGFYVPAIRPPTVAQGQARLRVTLSAQHDPAEVEQLLDALAGLAHSAAPIVDSNRPVGPDANEI